MTTVEFVSVTAAMSSKPNGGRQVPNLCCDGEAAEILGGRCFEDLVYVVKTHPDFNEYLNANLFPHAFVTVQLPSRRQYCRLLILFLPF